MNSQVAHAKMKVYYAHPLSLYDTKQEATDLETLTRLGFEVVNPNSPAVDKEYKQSHDFNVFLNLIRSSDLLAFRSFPDGSISSGVASEIHEAKTKNLPVIELPSGLSKRVLNREQTLEFLVNSGSKISD